MLLHTDAKETKTLTREQGILGAVDLIFLNKGYD